MKIVIVAGGTGGHLYPGVALARSLVGHEVTFVVRRGDLGRDILSKEGFAIQDMAGQGLPRSFTIKSLLFPLKFLLGFWEATQLLIRIKPDWVVGMGGYLSVPVVLVARILRIRCLLHEQNVYPGVANRFLGHWANSVAVSFPESQAYFPARKTWVSGLPVRPEIGQTDKGSGRRHFNLDMQKTTYLVFGGSLGAQKLNTLATEVWPLLLQKSLSFQVLHITGKNDYDRVPPLYNPIGVDAKILPYCYEMAYAYAASDIVISRAGASTIAELLVARCRALLVPYPHATHNHQLYNARLIERAGLGKVVEEKGASAQIMADFLSQVSSPQTVHTVPDLSSGAALRLAHHLTTVSV